MKFSIKNVLVLSLFFVSSVCKSEEHQISPEEIQELKSYLKYDDLSDPEQRIVYQNIEKLQLILNRSSILEQHLKKFLINLQ